MQHMTLKGSCHCGELKWNFSGPLESATACNCTVCRRYGVLWAYGHLNEEIKVFGANRFYARNNKVIGFHFCENCGCVGYWLATKPGADGKKRIAVNLRLVENPDSIQHLLIDHFDGLDKFEDLPRDGRCIRDLWF